MALVGMKSIKYSVFILWLIPIAAQECPPAEYGAVLSYGESCQFKCRCLNNEQCDSDNGECPAGCAPGWMGPGCQYANQALNKKATQKDTFNGDSKYAAKMAVDGDEETCSKTIHKEDGRWCLDFGEKRHIVGMILVVPQQDPVVLDDFIIYVSNESYAEKDKLDICYWQKTPPTDDVTLTHYEIMCYKPLYGQFLIIHKRKEDKTELALCEVQVYGGRELAFRNPSVHTSTLNQFSTGAENAVDGRAVASDIMQCSASQETSNPSWQVDLGRTYTIYRVVLHNVEDEQLRALLAGFEVVISKEATSPDPFVHVHQDPVIEEITEVSLLRPVDGRYVTIRLPGHDKQLVLCEVDVLGDCPVNLCGIDCVDNCWCNNTLTGAAQQSGTCSYDCSEKADPSSKPKCNIAVENNKADSNTETGDTGANSGPGDEQAVETNKADSNTDTGANSGPGDEQAGAVEVEIQPESKTTKHAELIKDVVAKPTTTAITSDEINNNVSPTTHTRTKTTHAFVDIYEPAGIAGSDEVQVTTSTAAPAATNGEGAPVNTGNVAGGNAGVSSNSKKEPTVSNTLSGGQLIGIIFGCLALVLVGGVVVFMVLNWLRKRKRQDIGSMSTRNLPKNIEVENNKETKAYENPVFVAHGYDETDTKV